MCDERAGRCRCRCRRRRGAVAAAAAALVALVTFSEVSNHVSRVPALAIIGADPQRGRSVPTVEKRSPPDNDDAADDETVREGCSCVGSRQHANATCCQRAVLTNHKFGFVLSSRLFKPFESSVERGAIHPDSFPVDPTRDYRHAALARNFYDALVSGYRYHASGRECWLTFNGRRRPTELNRNWGRFLNRTQFDIHPYPARDGRSICRYLADVPEEVGMRVYIAVALEWWYSGLDDYYTMVQERTIRGDRQRTLILCLSDYPDGPSQERMFHQIMDWLHPSGHNLTVPRDAITDSPDHGGHSPSRNSTQVLRLRRLVKRLDRDVFNRTITRTDSLFGCKGTQFAGPDRVADLET